MWLLPWMLPGWFKPVCVMAVLAVLAVCVFAPPRAWDDSFDPAAQFCPRTVSLH